ncbi:hypothetical protein KCU73_g10683, partial [Aureobasidium melanogenum]
MPTNLLSLPPELLLRTANYLPPSSVLALRLVNKHLCAAIEKAFNTLCLAEVTFPFTAYGLRSLVHFSRSPTLYPPPLSTSQNLELEGPFAGPSSYILNLQKHRDIITNNNNNLVVSCQLHILSRCRNRHVQKVVTGDFTAINGSGIHAGVKEVLGSAHHRPKRPLKYNVASHALPVKRQEKTRL